MNFRFAIFACPALQSRIEKRKFKIPSAFLCVLCVQQSFSFGRDGRI